MQRPIVALISVLVLAGLSVTACNTVEGLGKDTEAAGEAIQDSAEDVKDDL